MKKTYQTQRKFAIRIMSIYIIGIITCIIALSSCTTYEHIPRAVPVLVDDSEAIPETQQLTMKNIDDVEDMIEFFKWDIERGKIDPTTGELYLKNLYTLKEQLWNTMYYSYIEHESTQ